MSNTAFGNWNQFVTAKGRKSKQMRAIVEQRIQEAGMIYENDAKSKAPVKSGHHAQNIGYRPINWHSITMFANAKYAPFLEFGTGDLVSIPTGWAEVAIQFKGKGIKKINLPARPHIIPAFQKAKVYLMRQLRKDIRRLK